MRYATLIFSTLRHIDAAHHALIDHYHDAHRYRLLLHTDSLFIIYLSSPPMIDADISDARDAFAHVTSKALPLAFDTLLY